MVQYWGNGNVVSEDQNISRRYSDLYRDLVTAGVHFPSEQKYLGLYSFGRTNGLESSRVGSNQDNENAQAKKQDHDYGPLIEKIDNLERIRNKVIDLTMDGNHHVNELAIAYDMYLIARRSVNNDPLAIKLAKDPSDTFKHIKVRGKVEIDISSSLAKAWEGFISNKNFTIYQLICSEVLKAELGVNTVISTANTPKRSLMPSLTELKRLANDSGTPITPAMDPVTFGEMAARNIQSIREDSFEHEFPGKGSNPDNSQSGSQSGRVTNPVPPGNPFESFGAPSQLSSSSKLQTYLTDKYVKDAGKANRSLGKQYLGSPGTANGGAGAEIEGGEIEGVGKEADGKESGAIGRIGGGRGVGDPYMYGEEKNWEETEMESRRSGRFGGEESDNGGQVEEFDRDLQRKTEAWRQERIDREMTIERQLREMELVNLEYRSEMNEKKLAPENFEYISTHNLDSDFKEKRLRRESELQKITEEIEKNKRDRLSQEREFERREEVRIQQLKSKDDQYKLLPNHLTSSYTPPQSPINHPLPFPAAQISPAIPPFTTILGHRSNLRLPAQIQPPALHTISSMTDPTDLTTSIAKFMTINIEADRKSESMRQKISSLIAMIENKRLAIHAARSEAKSVRQVKQGTEKDMNELRMLKHAEHIKRSELINEQNKLQLLQVEIENYNREKNRLQDTMVSINDISAISHRMPYAYSRENSRGRRHSPPIFTKTQGNEFLGDFNKELNNLISMTSFEKSYIEY